MTTVTIAGGGLAGLACAQELVERGVRVKILEAKDWLGGRAGTWVDADGDVVEEGLHLFLGVYDAFLDVLRRIARPPEETLFFMPEVRLEAVDEQPSLLGTNPLAAPLKTATSLLLDHRALGFREKAHMARFSAPAARSLGAIERAHDDETVIERWRKVSGDERLLERLLRPYCRGIQFTEPEQFSAAVFLGLQHHLARQPQKSLLGGYLGPRDENIFRPFARALIERGVEIHVGTKIERVLHKDHDVDGLVLQGGDVVKSDIYVMAMPVWELVPLLPKALMRMRFFAALADLPIAPAISVQLAFDERVVETPHFTLVGGSPACVYQDLSTSHIPDERGSRISVIVSPADAWLAVDDDEIVARVLDDLSRAHPGFGKPVPRKSWVLKHRRHLVRPLPGVARRRPSQQTPVRNLFFAGDWTRQPFYGSQEGAVRAGRLCADRILESLGITPHEHVEAAHP